MARKCVRFGRGKGGRKVCRKYSGTARRKAKKSAGSKTKKCAGLKGKGKLKKGYTWKGAKKGGCPKRAG